MSRLHKIEDVGDVVVTRVESIRTTNGYETDIGATVFRGRRKVDDSMLPCTSVIEAVDEIESSDDATEYLIGQRFLLFAYLACDPDNPNVAAHAAIRDMKRAIFRTGGKADVTWGRTIKAVRYLGKDIGPRADGSAFVLASIEFVVSFVEDVADP